MRRLLLGFVFGIALLASGTASALVSTSGEFPEIDHEHRIGSIVNGFIGSVVTDIQLIPCTPEPPQFRPPFEWPRPESSHAHEDWKGKFPFFAHFPLFEHFPFGSFGDQFRHDEDDSPRSPVPEPTTALLFGAGLLGLGLSRRRQR